MATAARQLARYAAGLTLAAIPAEVRRRASACIADTLACAVFGARFPWSAATHRYARRYGGAGACSLLGVAGPGVQAPAAALANGAAAHAFEQDSLRFPGAGVHPGATLVPAILAACQETGADGARALLAFVAGCEVLFRIGAATHHSSEKLGFHAPGLTGPYGAAVAAGVVYGLSAAQIANALGIAGSMSSGLLAFTKSEQGAMVKRLHIGRAAEAGVVAARLAAEGYEGPETVLEGRFGFLDVYCRDGDAGLLTAGLGETWETLKICTKRYPCHVTAQAPVQALRELMREHAFDGADVTALALECNEKILSHHDIRAPGDVMTAQYSVPFCMALALYRDPDDPRSFDAAALTDPGIVQQCRALSLGAAHDLPTAWSARLSVRLRDGRDFQTLAQSFRGLPSDPLSEAQSRQRFLMLTAEALGEAAAADWYAGLSAMADQPRFPMPVL
jgi:2-methylcitrate dehydratase PrpD